MTDENSLRPEEHTAAAEAHPTEEAPEATHDAAAPSLAADATTALPIAPEGDPAPELEAEHPASEAPPEATDHKPAKTARKPRKSKTAAAAESHEPAEAEAAPAADEAPAAATAGTEAAPAADVNTTKKWYVVKVTSGREDTIKAAVERKVKIEGLEEFFGQIAIPVEELIQKKTVRVTDKKTGEKLTQEKKVIKYQKKFPGYIFAEVEFNDRILYLFRETSGVGDFVGASLKREPTPMTDREVRAMLTGVVDGEPGKPNQKAKVKLDYEKGDKVKIRDGAFANMEGIVKSIMENKDTGETPKVKVEVTIFGRPVEVDLDYWHVDKA